MIDRLLSRLALLAVLALIPVSALAQNHAHGTAWIHRDAPVGTMVHARGDSLCTVEFPASCHHGMMSPDSLYCSWQTVPPDSMPGPMARYCGVAVHCVIGNEYGQMMMPGHMSPMGLFRLPLSIKMHYDPAVMLALGMDLENLVLTTWIDGAPTVVGGATHDLASSSFTLPTTQVAEWYGISDRSALPTGVEGTTWGQIKVTYR
jgi:hypothetical protein